MYMCFLQSFRESLASYRYNCFAQYLKENGEEGNWPEFYGGLTREGRQIQVGNLKELEPGGDETFMSYDLPWANVSNSPFRLFKSFVHEVSYCKIIPFFLTFFALQLTHTSDVFLWIQGGISTPFVVHWPAAMSSTQHRDFIKNKDQCHHGRICHSPHVLMDIVATCCDLSGVPVNPGIEGESFLPILHGNNDSFERLKPIFWEHQGNRAVREGQWKLVYKRCDEQGTKNNDVVDGWELYNMLSDRTELHDLAPQNEVRVKRMAMLWLQWATRVGVKPWPLKPIPDGETDWSNLPWLWQFLVDLGSLAPNRILCTVYLECSRQTNRAN